MKTAFTLLAVFSCVLSTSALADGWKTLAGFNDSVTLKNGETAFIVSVSEEMVVQYDKAASWPPRPVQFRLGADRGHHGFGQGNTAFGKRAAVAPTARNPFPLSGPCKISVKTNGVVTMKLVSSASGK